MSGFSGKEGDSLGMAVNTPNNLFELQNGRVVNLVGKDAQCFSDYPLHDTSIPGGIKGSEKYDPSYENLR